MREQNKFLNQYVYNGKMDVGGNDQQALKKHYFKPFWDNKNIQVHGQYANGIDYAGSNFHTYQQVKRFKD